ncbi:MAG: Holliday junction branch migration protein RuvA [Melioribacteraceae bacterium]|nr:Holliday junction branch migration protein RuvA [Ignavibacteriota bacterium]MBZ0181159.1 Holliday junction branch migration protein RuvA [Melioribacteraceae bacterium]|tara:strand:+ start:643 stop:1233 length:591 start_codon:yes stop_codon:yes gene_type:complete
MIGYLTGKIISIKPTEVLLDVNGVGYLIHISLNTFEKISNQQGLVSLHTYLSVKEDALDLFGFFTKDEKEMYQLLISVNGIGPKLGLSILSGIQINDLKEAIKTGNLSRLISIPGIGRKTGERLLIELRDKVDSLASSIEASPTENYKIKSDAIAALVSLGYNLKSAEKAVRNAIVKDAAISIEDLIKEALSELNN